MKLQFYIYNIPFKRSFSTAQQSFNYRKGIVIALHKNGITALGEAAPLPDFSKETLSKLIQQISQKKLHLNDFFTSNFTPDDLEDFFKEFEIAPSLQFGLYTLDATYLAQKNQASLHELLFDEYSAQLPVNAVIDLRKDNILSQVEIHIKSGFKTIKIKTGKDWNTTESQIRRVHNQFEDLNIRVDANRSWSLAEAKEYLSQMEELDIKYCEEPLARPTATDLKSLSQSTVTPIALDETMVRWPNTQDMAKYASVLIIKPMVIGSVEKIKAIKKFADENNKELVFTTALGTGISRLMTATLAAGLGSKKMAHGLSTGSLLTRDAWDDKNFIREGRFILPDAKRLKNMMQSDIQKFQTEII